MDFNVKYTGQTRVTDNFTYEHPQRGQIDLSFSIQDEMTAERLTEILNTEFTLNLLDFEENIVLSNVTQTQIDSFLSDKDASLFLIEPLN